MKKSLFKVTALSAALALSFGLVGCGSDKPAEKPPAESVQQAAPAPAPAPAQEEKSKAAATKAETEKILQEMKPIADTIQKDTAAAIGGAKNLSATVADMNLFDVSFDMDIPDKTEEAAKAAGVEAIRTVQSVNPEYQFSNISVIVTSNGAPTGIVSFLPLENKWSIVAKGKRSEFTP